jgi:superfamily II DNA or RNA helicase
MFIKYSLGLSATLKRADGLSKVVNWFLGDTVVDVKQTTGKPDIEFCQFYPSVPFEEEVMINGKPNRMAMIVNMCNSEERNKFILDIINNNKHRVILVLTQIRNHATYLHSKLEDAGLYMGKMSLEELTESNTKNVIIGTYNMASEGYDNPRLDTLILATPKSDVEQAVGRILRKQNKNPPLVIDIQDFFSTFTYSNYKRLNFYKKRGFLKQKEKEELLDIEIRD